MRRLVGFRFARAFVLSALLAALARPGLSAPRVEPDPEAHRVIGGLYALAAAANLQGGAAVPSPSHLRRYFAETSADWLSAVQVAEAGGAWWVGVPVGRYSTARRFLRAHAPELGVLDGPGGRPWMGGEVAWMRAADVTGQGKKAAAKALPLQAALGSGEDAEVLFLGAPDADLWWQATPALTPIAREAALKRWGTKASGLHAPRGEGAAAEEFRASPVGLPQDIHLGRDSDDIDFSVEMGDMIFNPIPRMKNN